MILGLDHIVIAVGDLDRAIANYTALGFNVVRGGDHPGRSSHNALVVFADGTYFELIAFKAPARDDRWWQWVSKLGEGLVDFALLPQDTAASLAAAESRGLPYQGPFDGGRLRPDGVELRWQTARPASGTDMPFLCGDITPRALRVPEGAARVHPNGATGIACVLIGVHSLSASLQRYRALLGDSTAAQISAPFVVPGGSLELATVRIGTSTLVLASPLTAGDRGRANTPSLRAAAALAPTPAALALTLRERLQRRGEGPATITLNVAAPITPPGGLPVDIETNGLPIRLGWFPAPSTHGVALEWLVPDL